MGSSAEVREFELEGDSSQLTVKVKEVELEEGESWVKVQEQGERFAWVKERGLEAHAYRALHLGNDLLLEVVSEKERDGKKLMFNLVTSYPVWVPVESLKRVNF